MTHLHDFKTPGGDSGTPDTPITDWSYSKQGCSRCLIQVAGVSLLGKEQIFIPPLTYCILEHLNGNRHLEVLNETVICSFCEKIIFTELFDQHKLEFHKDALFKCAFDESCSAMVGVFHMITC